MKERRHEDVLLHETIVRLEAHETADLAMFKQISGQLGDLKTDVHKLFNTFWAAAVGAIMLLLAVSSYLYVESNRTNKDFMLELAKIVAERNNKLP